jgi:hypothetical protein
VTTFLDRLLGREPAPVPHYQKAVVSGEAWQNAIPLSTLNHSPQEKAATYLKAYKVGWFSKAGRKIAGDVSSLDWSISEGDQEEGDSQTEIPRPSMNIPVEQLDPIGQFMRLLEAPYRASDGKVLLTGRQLLHKTQVHLDFTGNACWYVGNSLLPDVLLPISPARMWPSRDKAGKLIGWVMDKDAPSGGTPFSTDEILWFNTGGADDDVWGTSVVESVYSQVPITDLMARHTATVMTMGGRLAGMLWPKERSLDEAEFLDAQRAWRNVASDPQAGKRLLIFPEPMEYAQGASTPAEIGIPELATLNRDEILTAFPISPYMLGVPSPGGLNSGEVRREDRRDYWEGTIAPRADLIEEVIQVGLLSRYEAIMNRTFDFELSIPLLDDAPTLMEKAAAFKGLISIGLDPKESLGAVGLDHIKWTGLPDLLDPAKQAAAAEAAQTAMEGDGSRTVVRDNTPRDNTNTQQTLVGKSREDVARQHTDDVASFLKDQRERVVKAIRDSYTKVKSTERKAWAAKADPEWFDAAAEDAALRETVRTIYVASGKTSLQVVADQLNRIVPNKAVDRVLADLMEYGGERIRDINAKTLQAITLELAEGTRRGYTVSQLIDGVPAEGFKGVLNVGMENGVGVWGDARAETISRTETALSYNRASLDAYKEFRVSRVLAYDGDTDADCAARNGREFDIDDAFSIADHPNGTLDWAPVIDVGKSYQEPQSITVDVGSPVINLHMAETKVVNELPAPIVSVTNDVQTPEVNVVNEVVTPSVTVQNDVKTPDVHVTNEVVTPSVTVNTPEVHVSTEPPVVNVTNEVVSPEVHVKAPNVRVVNEVVTPEVHVAPAEVTVTVPGPKTTTKTVNRDAAGRIVNITETTDGS